MVTYTTANNERIDVGKILCLARTYQKHAEEMESTAPKDPIVFLKPTTSIIGDGETILIPLQSNCIHHEVELGIIIGRTGKHIPEESAEDHIWGYLLALDITARDIQQELKDNRWPWTIAKGFDTFAPLSKALPKADIPAPHDLDIELLVNGSIRQHSNTSHMIHTLPHIVSHLSDLMTLERGDLILTGTPEGVDELKAGDIVQARLGEDLLCIACPVKKEECRDP